MTVGAVGRLKGVSETVIAAGLLFHDRGVEEIVAQLPRRRAFPQSVSRRTRRVVGLETVDMFHIGQRVICVDDKFVGENGEGSVLCEFICCGMNFESTCKYCTG